MTKSLLTLCFCDMNNSLKINALECLLAGLRQHVVLTRLRERNVGQTDHVVLAKKIWSSYLKKIQFTVHTHPLIDITFNPWSDFSSSNR